MKEPAGEQKTYSFEDVKRIVFSFCQWQGGSMHWPSFSHPPSLTDRWNEWWTTKGQNITPSADSKETCHVCGYTEEDAQLHGDHHLCSNKNPPWKKQSAQVENSHQNQTVEAANSKLIRALKDHAHYAVTGVVVKQDLAKAANVIEQLESSNAALKSELAEANENYEAMSRHCKYLTEINVFNMAFDKADEHWRKQHSVKEGENFIDWYMRHHAAEREADRKVIAALRLENENLKKNNLR